MTKYDRKVLQNDIDFISKRICIHFAAFIGPYLRPSGALGSICFGDPYDFGFVIFNCLDV
jgi:hypothetical protein